MWPIRIPKEPRKSGHLPIDPRDKQLTSHPVPFQCQLAVQIHHPPVPLSPFGKCAPLGYRLVPGYFKSKEQLNACNPRFITCNNSKGEIFATLNAPEGRWSSQGSKREANTRACDLRHRAQDDDDHLIPEQNPTDLRSLFLSAVHF